MKCDNLNNNFLRTFIILKYIVIKEKFQNRSCLYLQY